MLQNRLPMFGCTLGGFIAGVFCCWLLTESPREIDRQEIERHRGRIGILERLVVRYRGEGADLDGQLHDKTKLLSRILNERRTEKIVAEETIMRWQERCARAEWIVKKHHLEDEKVPYGK